MNRLDLIIDALDKVINACNLYDRQDIQDGGTVYLEEELEASIKALAAARELRALQPVAWQNLHLPDEFYDAELLDPSWYSHYRPLYALDEDTK